MLFSDYVDYNVGMARPKKDPALRMDADLRIPLTAEQKRILSEATSDEPQGMAAWARTVLIHAARCKLAKSEKKRNRL